MKEHEVEDGKDEERKSLERCGRVVAASVAGN